MAKQAYRDAQQPAPKPAPPAALDTPPPPLLALSGPLFGVTKGVTPGKWVAVRFESGRAEALSPKRGGKDVGEGLHWAIRRALEAFQASVRRSA